MEDRDGQLYSSDRGEGLVGVTEDTQRTMEELEGGGGGGGQGLEDLRHREKDKVEDHNIHTAFTNAAVNKTIVCHPNNQRLRTQHETGNTSIT